MAVNWIDTSKLSFNSLLLLESIQISWFPGWLPEKELAIALGANPTVEWFLRNKCPEIRSWLDKIVSLDTGKCNKNDIHKAKQTILNSINDLLTYVIGPSIYDAQPFLQWDSSELTSIVDFNGKIIIDVGAGTGKITFIAALKAQAVYAVEPVANLRFYLKQKAKKKGTSNVFPVDGLITDIPFQDNFADIVVGGYVFGDNKEAEHKEMERVTKKGGIVIYCPGNDDLDNERHQFLVNKGYKWSKFGTPGKGMKRKYLLVAFFYSFVVARELNERIRFSVRPISEGQNILLIVLILVICGSLYFGCAAHIKQEGFTPPQFYIKMFMEQMEKQIEARVPAKERQEVITQFRKEFQRTVDEFFKSTVKPYEKYIPLAIIAVLFMPLVTVTRLLVWVPTLLMSIIFLLLKAMGTVKLTSETREVHRLVIS